MSVFTGLTGPFLKRVAKTYDPRTGGSVQGEYVGTPVEIELLRKLFVRGGAKVQTDPSGDGGYDRMTVSTPDAIDPNETLADVWSLQGNDLEKSVWELPQIKAIFEKHANATERTQNLRDFKTGVENFLANKEEANTLAKVFDLLYDDIRTGAEDALTGFIYMLMRGVESFSVAQFVLRHTVIVPSNTNIRPAYANVGKIFATTDSLRQIENIPENFFPFDLPVGVWLKRTPTCEQTAPQRWQISQEWWHADKYEPIIYQVASAS